MYRLIVALAALTVFAGHVEAQTYPSRPVRIVVPFGPAGSGDITARTFAQRAGIPMTAVSYKAIGNAVADLMGRQIQVLFMEYVSGSSHIEGGKVVPLGVTGRERHKAWPGVPAIGEFYPGYELTAFLGLAAPARTPPDIIDALHGWLTRSIADPKVSQAFDKLGMASRAKSRYAYPRYLSKESEG